VLGEEKGRMKLVSVSSNRGLLPKGSYITIKREKPNCLRVDESSQHETYSPSPLVVEMNLDPLIQDQKCQNIIYAYRVKDITDTTDVISITFHLNQLLDVLTRRNRFSIRRI